MSLRSYDDSSAATTITLAISEGDVSLFSNLAGTITITHWDGNDNLAVYTSGGSAVQLDASNSQAFIQGAGTFVITKPVNVPLAIVPSAKALVRVVSEA